MSAAEAYALVERYYAAFNAGDWEAMLACLADDVAHDINQGDRQTGKATFRAFLSHMDRCYRERLEDLAIMVSPDGTRAAAEFVVQGEYVATDEGLPSATGQRYTLPAGAFFEIAGERIGRVTVYYNLADWTRQVEG
ncbi:ketosteroid isomerase-related protein [Sphingomonas sp.]|uniref:ketosteroid isomerase-related protein n=1 Tax=Sphingomonas sp. TaxID=28214 RepID=UPI001AFF1C44|nr:ketosteroid isomerase-related protein [Sphingomonas sp.]MBO9714944.1 nuclear transport factor 2 family protein [Sphingomonas sp.]